MNFFCAGYSVGGGAGIHMQARHLFKHSCALEIREKLPAVVAIAQPKPTRFRIRIIKQAEFLRKISYLCPAAVVHAPPESAARS